MYRYAAITLARSLTACSLVTLYLAALLSLFLAMHFSLCAALSCASVSWQCQLTSSAHALGLWVYGALPFFYLNIYSSYDATLKASNQPT